MLEQIRMPAFTKLVVSGLDVLGPNSCFSDRRGIASTSFLVKAPGPSRVGHAGSFWPHLELSLRITLKGRQRGTRHVSLKGDCSPQEFCKRTHLSLQTPLVWPS